MTKLRKGCNLNMAMVERDVLRAVYDYGGIRPGLDGPDTAYAWLAEKYDMSDLSTSRLVTCVNDYLVEQRYLWPYFDSENRQVRPSMVRSITPKGIDRLQELEHPVGTWVSRNWFPVVVAIVTSALALGDLALRIVLAL